MADHPIVVFGDDWGRHVSSMQHLFQHIIPRRQVVWVNGIGHRVPTLRGSDLRRAWEKARRLLAARPAPESPTPAETGPVTPHAVIDSRVLPWHHLAMVHHYNTAVLLRDIRGALANIGGGQRPIVVTGSPPSVGVLGRLDELASVYFCMDDFLHLADVSPWMLGPLERRLLERVDLVVATAASLTESKRPRSGRSVHLPQGVNYRHFATTQSMPEELTGLPRPLIGFAGGLSNCCDFPLIRGVAQANPQGTVVLVGPWTADGGREHLQAPNIRLLGARPYQRLPAYVQQFDVGLIPYLYNSWTEAVDPLKLLEYLAAGVPVVTTAIPEVRKYAEAVAIAEGHDAFLQAVTNALAQPADRRADRQAVAQRHTWASRAETFLAWLDQLVAEREPGAAHA